MLKLSHLETHPRILTNIRNFKFRALFSQGIHWPTLNTCPAHWLELQKMMYLNGSPPSFLDVWGSLPRKLCKGEWPLPPFVKKGVFFPIWSVWTLRYCSHSLMGKNRKNRKHGKKNRKTVQDQCYHTHTHTLTWMFQVVKFVPVHLKEPTERQTCYISARSYKQICMHKVSPKEIRFQDHLVAFQPQCFGVMQLWYYVERFACKGTGSM